MNCDRCGARLACHCGEYVEDHHFGSHTAVPMTCDCEWGVDGPMPDPAYPPESEDRDGRQVCRTHDPAESTMSIFDPIPSGFQVPNPIVWKRQAFACDRVVMRCWVRVGAVAAADADEGVGS